MGDDLGLVALFAGVIDPDQNGRGDGKHALFIRTYIENQLLRSRESEVAICYPLLKKHTIMQRDMQRAEVTSLGGRRTAIPQEGADNLNMVVSNGG